LRLLLKDDAQQALLEAKEPDAVALKPMLTRLKQMMGMTGEGTFNEEIGKNFLKTYIENADPMMLDHMSDEIGAVTGKDIYHFIKAMSCVMIKDFKATDKMHEEFTEFKKVEFAVMSYLYANLAMVGDNGHHSHEEVKKKIRERRQQISDMLSQARRVQEAENYANQLAQQIVAEQQALGGKGGKGGGKGDDQMEF
jgi:hypothetical protein